MDAGIWRFHPVRKEFSVEIGMDGLDGGWAVLSGSPFLTSTSIGQHACEDQLGDSEQNHTTEQVGYIVFE